MKRRTRIKWSRYGQGFSLIELMVSLSIGLAITAAAFSAYLGASSASKMMDAQIRMNEDAQAAISILSHQIRMAGYNPDQANRTDESRRNPIYGEAPTFTTSTPALAFSASPASFALSNYAIRGCNGKFSNITSASQLDTLICDNTSGTPNAIGISYEADKYNTIATLSGLPTDCLGYSLTKITATVPTINTSTPTLSPTSVDYFVADNRFYIATSSSAVPSLYCKGNGGGGTAQPLVENIEDLQLSYGTVKSTLTTDSTATVAGYLTAEKVSADTGLALLADDAARWRKVLTVRICVLVRSEALVVNNAASAAYTQCDGQQDATKTDRRLRRAYSSTVVLRNRRV
jgi:type IV pilus assembly protein PilW